MPEESAFRESHQSPIVSALAATSLEVPRPCRARLPRRAVGFYALIAVVASGSFCLFLFLLPCSADFYVSPRRAAPHRERSERNSDPLPTTPSRLRLPPHLRQHQPNLVVTHFFRQSFLDRLRPLQTYTHTRFSNLPMTFLRHPRFLELCLALFQEICHQRYHRRDLASPNLCDLLKCVPLPQQIQSLRQRIRRFGAPLFTCSFSLFESRKQRKDFFAVHLAFLLAHTGDSPQFLHVLWLACAQFL